MTARSNCFEVSRLGECLIDSPLSGTQVHFTQDESGILLDRYYDDIIKSYQNEQKIPVFEEAGPRQKIFHDPRWSKAAILTAGGLCPGLNSVIKGITLTLIQTYGIPLVYGIPYGY